SSMLDFRKKLPTGVNQQLASRRRWLATSGVSIRMDRNFGIQNKLPWAPTRRDQKMIGPFDVNRIAKAATAPIGRTGMAARIAIARSNDRFANRFRRAV